LENSAQEKEIISKNFLNLMNSLILVLVHLINNI